MNAAPGSIAVDRSPANSELVQWPAASFYWGLLDSSTLGRLSARGRTRRLGYLFEDVLPGVPIEDVHVVYQRLPKADSRYVACAAPRAMIEHVLETQFAATALVPQCLPDHLVSTGVGPGQLNLLTGEFAPKRLRELRRQWLTETTAIFVLVAVFLIMGFERRQHLITATAHDVGVMRAALVDEVLGPDGSQLPDDLRLTARLRTLEQTRFAGPDVLDVVDASGTLAALLAVWPADVETTTESVSVTSSSISLRVTVNSMDDAQHLANSLRTVVGWTMAQPRSEARSDHVDVTIGLEREE